MRILPRRWGRRQFRLLLAAAGASLKMNLILLRLPDEEERLLQSLAAHEAGHAVVAGYFRLEPRAFVGGPRSGICRHKPGTGFQNGAVVWGGIVGEEVLRCRHPKRTLPTCDLSPATFFDWTAQMLSGGLASLDKYSKPDADAIRQSNPQEIETARAAFTILTARRDPLEWWAEKLVDRDRFRAALTRNSFAADERAATAAVRR